MLQAETITVKAEMPVQLFNDVQQMVTIGWYRNANELILDALRRFLESHRVELQEEFIQQDVAWGLRGNE